MLYIDNSEEGFTYSTDAIHIRMPTNILPTLRASEVRAGWYLNYSGKSKPVLGGMFEKNECTLLATHVCSVRKITVT